MISGGDADCDVFEGVYTTLLLCDKFLFCFILTSLVLSFQKTVPFMDKYV